jgi:palmitoyltransferase ZDHHC2/15/20
MDHHCPWLATCVGLRNYKAFLLFLAYTSLFCWLCFAVSASWVWHEVMVDGQMDEGSVMPIHFVMLSVVSGIIGLVLSGFTAWHVYLTAQNRTTIESLEKTRYLSPVRSHVSQRIYEHHSYADDQNHSLGEQLRDLGNSLVETHANALPGVLRPEEGEERQSPALDSLRQNVEWDSYSRRREQEQYNEYLDERDNAKLPNAFHLGWQRNVGAVLGPNIWLWPLPICNSIGDGWVWESNPQWLRERARLKQEREMETRRLQGQQGNTGRIAQHHQTRDVEAGFSNADRVLARGADQYAETSLSSSLPGPRRPPRSSAPAVSDEDIYDSSDDELLSDSRARLLGKARAMDNWNDVPDDMVNGRRAPSGD